MFLFFFKLFVDKISCRNGDIWRYRNKSQHEKDVLKRFKISSSDCAVHNIDVTKHHIISCYNHLHSAKTLVKVNDIKKLLQHYANKVYKKSIFFRYKKMCTKKQTLFKRIKYFTTRKILWSHSPLIRQVHNLLL